MGEPGEERNSVKKDFYNLFYCNYILLSYQAMSSPQSSHSQLDPSLTSDVHTLIAPFSSLSIESHREEQVVESGASRKLKEGEFLLND